MGAAPTWSDGSSADTQPGSRVRRGSPTPAPSPAATEPSSRHTPLRKSPPLPYSHSRFPSSCPAPNSGVLGFFPSR